MNKNLVCLIAFGETYQALATMVVQSIRIFGFDGDIVVFTDKEFELEGARVDVVLDGVRDECIRNNTKYKTFRNTTGSHEYDYLKARTCIDLFMDLSPYKFLFYMDCDTLAGGDITPLFEITDDKLVCLMQRHKSLAQGMGDLLFAVLPEDRKEFAHNNKKSNAGVIGIPMKIGKEFFPRWRQLYEKYAEKGIIARPKTGELDDEPLLNYMIARGDVDRVFESRIGYKAIREDKLIYHFIGKPQKAIPLQKEVFDKIVAPKLEAK